MRISGLNSQTYLPFSESSEWHEAKPRTSQLHLAVQSARRHVDLIVAFDLETLALFPLEDLEAPWFLLVLLGNGTLGRRVAPLSVPYAYP